MTGPDEYHQKGMDELLDEINTKTKCWFQKLKEQSKNTSAKT
jgi:hypothetical protein